MAQEATKQQNLANKLIEWLKREITKEDTQKRWKISIVQPLFLYLYEYIEPFILVHLLLIFLILILQVYIISHL